MRERLAAIYADVREGLIDRYGLVERKIDLPETFPYAWEQIVSRDANWLPKPAARE